MGAGSAPLERAFAHDTAGRDAEAIPEYREAVEAGLEDDDLLAALLGLGSSLRNVGELEESERILRQAVTRFPDHAALRVFLSFTRWSSGHQADAVRELLEALFRAEALGMARYQRAIRGYAAEF